MRSIRLPLTGCLLLMLAGMASCVQQTMPPTPVIIEKKALVAPPSAGELSVPVSWYQLELKLIKETPGFSSPAAARAIAYTGITLYEAIATDHSFSGRLNGLRYVPKQDRWKRYNKAIIVNSAMAHIIRGMFPNADEALITKLENDNLQLYSDTCHSDVMYRSISFGRQLATAIYLSSVSNGGKDVYSGMVNDPALSGVYGKQAGADIVSRVLALRY